MVGDVVGDVPVTCVVSGLYPPSCCVFKYIKYVYMHMHKYMHAFSSQVATPTLFLQAHAYVILLDYCSTVPV